jgi:hypothetical protein
MHFEIRYNVLDIKTILIQLWIFTNFNTVLLFSDEFSEGVLWPCVGEL